MPASPPHDPRRRFPPDRLTWRDVLGAYAAIASVPLALWGVANPLTGALALATVAGLLVVGPSAVRLARCVVECERLTFEVGRTVRVTVARSGCCESP